MVHYNPPRVAILADGEKKPIIPGFIVCDIMVKTRAGEVLLTATRIDVLNGPESQVILYLGKEEEARLGLRTYAEQLEDVARAKNAKSAAVAAKQLPRTKGSGYTPLKPRCRAAPRGP